MAARDERATSGEYIEPGEITALAQRADVIGNVATFDRGVDRPAEQGNRERDADCRSQRRLPADRVRVIVPDTGSAYGGRKMRAPLLPMPWWST